MSAKKTVIIFVHGANQGDKNEAKNHQVWKEAFQVSSQGRNKLIPLLNGNINAEISSFHKDKNPNRSFPEYIGWKSAWYGALYKEHHENFEDKLNPLSAEDNENKDLIFNKTSNRLQRKIMKEFFDELVPFYELAVIQNEGLTFYEKVCSKFLDDLILATNNGEYDYVLVGHSMGCAVTYNVMSHISNQKENIAYCNHITGILTNTYRQKVKEFVDKNSQCFGLMTFGNYTGYNWCQRLNNQILYGELKRQFIYPSAVSKWFNFWTFLGGDPVIIDDIIGDDMVNDDAGNFKDITIFRIPLVNVGHQRTNWFKRANFVNNLVKKLKHSLYTIH